MSTAKTVMQQIIETGSVQRGWIGVGVQDVTLEMAQSFKLPETRGALITEVLRGTPAERGGIRAGDVLVGVEGKPVTDSSSMLNLIAALRPGTTATLRLLREAKPVEVRVTVARRPQQKQQGQPE